MEQLDDKKRRRDGGNSGDNRDLYLIQISPDVSDDCVYGEIKSGYKTGRERAEDEVAQTCSERDLGEVSTLQQETLQSAFNHSRLLLCRPSRRRGGQQQRSQVLPPLPSDNNSVH